MKYYPSKQGLRVKISKEFLEELVKTGTLENMKWSSDDETVTLGLEEFFVGFDEDDFDEATTEPNDGCLAIFFEKSDT